MAHMSQEHKKRIAAALALVVPKDWKYSLSVENHSAIVLTVYAAPVDLVDVYTASRCSEEVRASALRRAHVDINPYSWKEHFSGELLELFGKIFAALNIDNYNRSDMMTDYHDVGHYVYFRVGRWDKPFKVMTQKESAPAPAPLEWAELWAAMKVQPFGWVRTTLEMFDSMLGVVPPRAMAGNRFLVGEADHHNDAGHAVYACFRRDDGGELVEARYMTAAEFGQL